MEIKAKANTAEPQQPKEKPLRIKRGHRKPSAIPDLDKTEAQRPPSPSSEISRTANGSTAKAAVSLEADTPFALYALETGHGAADEEARAAWDGMEKEERESWEARFEEKVGKKDREGDETEGEVEAEIEAEVEGEGEGDGGEEAEDVEMGKGEKEGSEDKEKAEEEDVEMGDAEEKK